MDKKSNIRNIIFILILILIIVIAVILSIILSNYGTETSDENISQNTNTSTPVEDSEQQEAVDSEEDTEDEISEEQKKLTKTNNVDTYFLMKYCLETFYYYNDYDDINITTDYIDKEAIEEFNANKNNFNTENKGICIDEIYRQYIDNDKSIFAVYFRFGEISGNITNKVVWIKINEENELFSIYPYEYLRLHNYLNLKTNDIIPIKNENEIEKNENNSYSKGEKEITTKDFINELFRRYKFDLLLDIEHLYNSLDGQYKENRFNNIEKLKQYIQENKSELYLDNISTYSTINNENYVQYTGESNIGKNYVFRVRNVMDYTIFLDNYTIMTSKDEYNKEEPNEQAKICIDRVIQAINDKNYEFVYEKLNAIQKNNYYKNIEDLEEFLKRYFYDKTSYEIHKEYLMISADVYQYTVKITDTDNKEFSYRNVTMAITLKDSSDFEVSIVN